MNLKKIVEKEIKKDNEYLKENGVLDFKVVSKTNVGEIKIIEFVDVKSGAVAPVKVSGGVISYNGNQIDLPNMFEICETILGVNI